MPNWCENDLTIRGKPEEVDKLLAAIKSGEGDEEAVIDFDKVLPVPKELEGIHSGFTTIDGESVRQWRMEGDKTVRVDAATLAKKYGAACGLDWQIHHWGTKWNSCVSRVKKVSKSKKIKSVVLSFNTAWSPPSPVIEKLAEMFPEVELTLRYYERGMAFKGKEVYEGGKLVDQEDGHYSGRRGG